MTLQNFIPKFRITIIVVILLVIIILFRLNNNTDVSVIIWQNQTWEIKKDITVLVWNDVNEEWIENIQEKIVEKNIWDKVKKLFTINKKSEILEEKDNKIIEENVLLVENSIYSNVLLSKTSFSSNINNLLEINWNNLDKIKSIHIWKEVFEPKFNKWTIYIWIDSGLFYKWNYKLYFKWIDWNLVDVNQEITFMYSNSKVNLANITPNVLKNDIDRNIVLQWSWFSKIISIQLSNNIIIKNTNFNIINDNVMSLLIPKWLNIWKYKLNIMDIEWIYKSNLEIEIIN